jgi:hypothetical protein
MAEKRRLQDLLVFVPSLTTAIALAWQIGRLQPTGGFFYFSLTDHLVAAAAAVPIAFAFAAFFATVTIFLSDIVRRFPKLRWVILLLLAGAEMVAWWLEAHPFPGLNLHLQLSDVLTFGVIAFLVLMATRGGAIGEGAIWIFAVAAVFFMLLSADLTRRNLGEADVRRKATREGWCHRHVDAIIVAIDQYAEAATGNREYFLNKPHSIGPNRRGDVP